MSLFIPGAFVSHSGIQLPWKIDCDALSDDDLSNLAWIVAPRLPRFRKIRAVPKGGVRFARALFRYRSHPFATDIVLVVDDVLTTGASVEAARRSLVDEGEVKEENVIGVVIFARGSTPSWVLPIFTVGEWLQKAEDG